MVSHGQPLTVTETGKRHAPHHSQDRGFNTMTDITRPIIGIENRSAQEVFDIMVDRIRSVPAAIAVETKPVAWRWTAHNASGFILPWEYSNVRPSWLETDGFVVQPLYAEAPQPLLDAPRVKWQGSAGDLLASLDPDTLNPEQFNAWSALRRIIDAWDNNSGHEPSVSVLELAIDEARDTLSTDLVGVSPITKLAYLFQSIMSETLTVDPSDNEIMGTGKASFLMARAAISATKSGEAQ